MSLTELESWMPVLLQGLLVSLELTAVASLLTFAFATMIALLRISPLRPIRLVTTAFVDLDRSVPLLALLIFVYFGLGKYLAFLGLPAFWVAVLAISVNEAAYLGEVYRAAIESISQEQWDAATSLGLSRRQTLALVILPQAVPAGIPPTVNDVIYILKASSLASLVSVNELTNVSTQLVSVTFLPMQIYMTIGAMYLALTVPLSYFARWLEVYVNRRLGLRVPPEAAHGAVVPIAGGTDLSAAVSAKDATDA